MTPKIVNPERLESVEQYCVSLLTGILSLTTLHKYHTLAVKKGLLSDESEKTAMSIMWELKRLQKLYQVQIDNCMDIMPQDFDLQKAFEEYKQISIESAKNLVGGEG